MITPILISWFKTFESKQQTQKAQKDDKLVSKRNSRMECFTADFLQFFTGKSQNWLLGGRLGASHQIQAF